MIIDVGANLMGVNQTKIGYCQVRIGFVCTAKYPNEAWHFCVFCRF